jgi:hypothetical protein
MRPLHHNGVISAGGGLEAREVMNYTMAFHIRERGQGRVWFVGARSILALFRSGVHVGVRGCTLACSAYIRNGSAFGSAFVVLGRAASSCR